MLLDIIKNIRFESITSESTPSVGQPNFSLTVNWSAYKKTVPDEQTLNLLRGIRLRCFVATTSTSSTSLDFITQRFNEYLLAEQTTTAAIEVSPEMFTKFIRRSLSLDNQQYMSSTNPVSPYSVASQVVTNMFVTPQTPVGTGKALSKGVVMYDSPLLDLAARDTNGNILELSSDGGISVPLVVPAPPQSPQDILDTVSSSARKSINGSLVNDILNKTSRGTATDRIFLTPVTIPFVGQTIEEIQQLSLYVYAYVPSRVDSDGGVALGVPITPIVAINLKGIQSLWAPATTDRLLVRMRPANTAALYAPHRGLLHILDNQTAASVREKITTGWNSFFNPPKNVISEANSELAGLFQDNAPYSKLWATVDHNKSVRFSFAVNQAEFLKSKSVLPYFYSNNSMATKLLSPISADMNPEKFPPMRSNIRSIKIKRHICDQTATMPGNDVSTSAHLSPRTPDATYRAEYVSNPQEIKGIVGFKSLAKIKFYEGTDHLDTNNKNSIYYSVDIEAYDAAPDYLRYIVKKLFSFQTALNHLYSHLMDIHPHSAAEGVVLTSLSSHTLNFDNTNERYDSFILKMLEEYAEILNDTLPGDPINITPYMDSVRALSSNMPLRWLTEIQNMLNLGINLYFNKLKSVFPGNPLGDTHTTKLFALESVGLKQTLYPIVQGEHNFSQILNPSAQVGYGQDFIFSHDQQDKQKDASGLLRMQIPDIFQRFSLEFNKYFQPSAQPSPVTIDSITTIPNPANIIPTNMTYLSPRTIITPSRKPLDQISSLQRRGASYVYYDLDRYADLFVDLVRTRTAISQLFYGAPVVAESDRAPQDDCSTLGEESLYSSVVADLGQTHGTLLDSTLTPQYSPPHIMSGEYEPTAGLTSAVPYLPGPLAVPSIVGGLGSGFPALDTYVSEVDATLTNLTEDKESANKSQTIQAEFQRPLKFPFAIFGEMSVDSKINLDVTYQDMDFNSMRGLVNAFGVNNINVREMIEGIFNGLPFQLKSMMVVAASSADALLFPNSLRGPYNATRPILDDKNKSNNLDQAVSFWESGLDQPAYGTTLDPMKMYSKFLAFWLNYKQLGTVECLSRFGRTGENSDPNVVLDQWIPFSAGVTENLAPGEKMLCRVSPLTKIEYRDLLPSGEACDVYLQTSYGEVADVLNLPIYNQYFIIDQSTFEDEEPTDVEERNTPVVLYSTAQTKY